MSTYRLFPSTDGPSSAVSYSGPFISAVCFCVTGEGWFTGYWWWVCGTGQSTSPVKCALWQVPGDGSNTPVHVPGADVTSGTLTAGQWNYIPLSTPLMLSVGGTKANASVGGAVYIAAVGCNGSFPDTNSYWNTGAGAGGIVEGPLTAYCSVASTSYGTAGCPYDIDGSPGDNGLFTVGSSDPTSSISGINGDSTNDNFWVDVQIGDDSSAPSGTSYRLWPNFPTPTTSCNGDTGTTASATEVWLSESCGLDRIWFFSPSGAVNLPQRCGIWEISSQTEVSGTDNTSPLWLLPGGGGAAAGDGWCYVDYTSSGVVLAAGKYRVATWNGLAAQYYKDNEQYWNANGAGINGINAGPLFAPNAANASDANWDDSSGSKPAQDVYQDGAWAFPDTGETHGGLLACETRWQDIEVTPTSSSSSPSPTPTATQTSSSPPPPVTNSRAFLTFFP